MSNKLPQGYNARVPAVPRVAAFIITVLSDPAYRGALLGDMEEACRLHIAQSGNSAKLWYWRQVAGAFLPLLAAKMKRQAAGLLLLVVLNALAAVFMQVWDTWAAQQAGWRLSSVIFGDVRTAALITYLTIYLVGAFLVGAIVAAGIAARMRCAQSNCFRVKTLPYFRLLILSLVAALPVLFSAFGASGDVLVLRAVQVILCFPALLLGAVMVQRHVYKGLLI